MNKEKENFLNLLPRLFCTIGLAFNFLSGIAGLPLIIAGLILSIINYKKLKEKEGFFSLLFSVISLTLNILYLILITN